MHSVRYSLPATVTSEPTALVALGLDDFVLGTNDGGVYRCWGTGRQVQLMSLRQHRFMVSTLLRTEMGGSQFVLSCDLSGQAFYHDMRLTEEVLHPLLNTELYLFPCSAGYGSGDSADTIAL